MKKLHYPVLVRIAQWLMRRFPFTTPFFTLLKAVFGNKLVKCMISLAFPIIFFIEGRSVTAISRNEIILFSVTGFFFAVLNALVLTVENYRVITLHRAVAYASILNKIHIMENDIASEIIFQSRNINNSQNFLPSNLAGLAKVVENNSIIDKIAYIICKSIFDWLKEVTDETCFKITVFQRFKDKQREYIDIIAPEQEDESCPHPERINLYAPGEKYYVRLLFEKNVNTIDVLATQKDIQAVKLLPSEEDVCQLVSVPVKINTRTTFIFQIASDKKDIFGKNKHEIKSSFKLLLPLVNMIIPFCYEDKLIKDLCNNFIMHYPTRTTKSRKRKETLTESDEQNYRF